jgi:hypothetical protein
LIELTEVLPNTHIYIARQALPPALCADMIARYETHSDEQYPGRVGQTEHENIDVKRSTDLVVSGKTHWRDVDRALFHSLADAMRIMRDKYSFFRARFKDYGYAIQRTLPNEYYHWHVDGGSHSFSDRQLVAIWYLNDVAGPGGETEFYYQGVSITPETGKLLLFPPFWTHLHRGVTLQHGVKYIATTWVLYA